MRKLLTFSCFLFCCFVGASDKNLYAQNSVGGFFIGKWGWVVSKVLIDDGLKHKDKKCYKKLFGFEVKNWQIEFGTPCNSLERIQPWLLGNNESNLTRYKDKLLELSLFFSYIFKEEFNLNLKVILVDESSYFKESFFSLNVMTNSIPLYVYAPVKSDATSTQNDDFYYAQMVDSVTHEFFHLYNRKYSRKKSKQFKKVLKKRENDEAIAMILGHCSMFALGISGFDVERGTDLELWYEKGGQELIDFQNLSRDNPKSHKLKTPMDKSRYGYAMGIITMWNQFGLDLSAENTEKVSDLLKFCHYVTNHIPSIPDLNQIKPSDYASEPQPTFYLENATKIN